MAADNYFPVLILQQDANFLAGTRYLRLIKTDYSGNPQVNSIGRAVISHPVHMRNGGVQVDFESTLKFRVAGGGTPAAGAGVTFFIAPKDYGIPLGSTGDKYGIFDPSATYTPHVFAAVFNTQEQTVGIHVQSVDAAISKRVDGLIGNDVTAKIYYDATNKKITVEVTIGENGDNPPAVTLGYDYDLGTILDEYVTVGISATTGDQVANHDALFWTVKPNKP